MPLIDPLHPRGLGPANWRWTEGDLTFTRSICWSPPGCHGGCGAILTTQGDRLVKVEGDPANPFNEGALCPRGLATLHTVYHPKRLLHPLLRAGPRGEGRWREVSWDEALAHTAAHLAAIRDESGPESVVFLKGTGRDIAPWISRLAYGFGSPNYFALGPANGNACFAPRQSTLFAMAGEWMAADCSQYHPQRYDSPTWVPPETLVVWGSNPVWSNPDGFLGAWIVRCMQRGTRLVVVDPRRTWLASQAHHWLPIRPGTDAALALAILRVIIEEGLYDRDFVASWTLGFKALQERVQGWTPAVAADITGLSAEAIRATARFIGESRPVAVHWGVGIDMRTECVPTAQALVALWTILGQVDVPGGMTIVQHPFGIRRRGARSEDFPNVVKDRIGLDRYPLIRHGIPYGQGDALLDQMESRSPYPIRAAWVQAAGLTVGSFADPSRAHRLFRALDFVAAADLFMTPALTSFADVVFPVCTWPERDGLRHSFYQVSAINAAIPPLGASRSDMQLCLDLGRILDPKAWPWPDIHALYDHILEPAGLSFAELREQQPLVPPVETRRHETGGLRPDGLPGFNTPSGRIELCSSEFAACGLDPLPGYVPGSSPDPAYPLHLITGSRVPVFFGMEHRNVPALRRFNPDPLVEVHPDALPGLSEGAWVWIETRHGRCKSRLHRNSEIPMGLAHAQASWWNPEGAPDEAGGLFDLHELCVNRLLPSHLQGKSGFGYPFRDMRCRIVPADGPPQAWQVGEGPCPVAPHASSLDACWCTGCHACELACQQENGFPHDRCGIVVRPESDGFRPVFTTDCTRCPTRRHRGLPPACVAHCPTHALS